MVADILHDWPIDVPIDRVFEAVSTSAGLDAWWTETSKGVPRERHEYELGFGPEFYRVSCNCGRCTCESCGDFSSMVRSCRMTCDWTCRMTVERPQR